MRELQDEQTRVLYELWFMIIHILEVGSPPLPIMIPFPNPLGPPSFSNQVSPTAFATLFLGISLALMLFGSVIFIIGFILMPWVIALVLLFYLAGILSSLAQLGRSILSPGSSRKDFHLPS